jgi:argininosuccinate lyase
MPQKKNPDIAELIRGKSARVTSNLMHMFGLLKGLPLSYNRDLQEDKIPLFDSLDQTLISIEGVTEMVKGMKFNPENMQNSLAKGFATATDLADYLVSERGIPFREAHELTGRLVSICVLHGWTLFTVPESNRREISEYFTGESYEKAISLPLSTDKKNVFGGTNLQRQQEQLKLAEELLERYKKKL